MYYLGIDLGGTNIAAGLVDENGAIIIKESIPTYRERHYSEIIKDMGFLVHEIMKKAQIGEESVKSIGIGSPGIANNKEGILVYSCNLNFNDVPMRAEMGKHTNLPVIIENDANCAALAESVSGAAMDADSSVTVTLGTGIGGGIVIDNKVYSGFNGVASELGHMVVSIGGEPCTCGRIGCWESYASATALIRMTRAAAEANPDSAINAIIQGDLAGIDAKTAFDAARLGDEIGKSIVEKYIYYIAEGLTNITNILMPEVIVIGGGVSKEGENLLAPLRELVYKGTYCRSGIPEPKIRKALMGNDAGIIGAAMLGR